MSGRPHARKFKVPKTVATPLRVIPGDGMAAAANEDVPLRERPPVVEEPGLFIHISRSGILITGALLAAVTIWCMTRLFTLVAWLFGVKVFEHHFVNLGGFAGVRQAAAGFLLMLSSLTFLLCSWGIYNWIRFHGPDRRRPPAPIRVRVLAAHYGLPPKRVRRWQYARRLIVYHDDRGVVRGATSEFGAWIRSKDDAYPVIKPNAFDILYLSARSRRMRRQAQAGKKTL